MPIVSTLVRSAARVRPFVNAVRKVEAASREGGAVGILPGDMRAADRLRHILAAPATDVPTEGSLLVHPAVRDADHRSPAAALARHKARGGRALALLVGRRGDRYRMEPEFMAFPPLEVSDLAHLPTLDGEAAAEAARAAVVDALGPAAPAAARMLPALRPAAARAVIERTSRQAGTIGALVFLSGADRPIIAMAQIRMVLEAAALHDRALGPERAPEMLAVLAASFGWRAAAGTALDAVRGPEWLVKGGTAYAGTRLIGEAASRWFAEWGEVADTSLAGLRDAVEGAVARTRGGGRG